MPPLSLSKLNKRRLLAVGIIVLFIAISLAGGRGAQRHGIRNTVAAIGREIIQTTNSYRLRDIDSDLQHTFSEILSSPTEIAQVTVDHHPFFGTATARMVLSNDLGHAITIRLRSDGSSGIYQVLGVSTVSIRQTNAAIMP